MQDSKYTHQLLKSNEIIQKKNFILSEQEQIMAASIIKKFEDNTYEYDFDLNDIYKEFGIVDNEENYRRIKQILKKLRDKSLFIIENDIETTISWINTVSIDRKNNIVKIKLDEKMENYLLIIKNSFLGDRLNIVLRMKSQYSIRLYDMFLHDILTKHKTLSVEELKNIFAVENINSYEIFKEFRKYVLDQAIKEINEYSDLIIEYEAVEYKNKIVKIDFTITIKWQL